MLAGKPLIVRVWQSLEALRTEGVEMVVAIDHADTAAACREHGLTFVNTREDHPSGTDRCLEASVSYPNKDYILNVQGDEPFINCDDLKRLMSQMFARKHDYGTLVYQQTDTEPFTNPNVVKVVLKPNNEAVYFSRSPVPWPRESPPPNTKTPWWQHIGVYAYSKERLESFCSLPPSSLEQVEKLEQLRAIEAGWPILTVRASSLTHGIDTPEDLEAAQKKWKASP
jgi:3-deoxy-manno-octulosonate cytidylyltransferase (CMP-KDO synthetase)